MAAGSPTPRRGRGLALYADFLFGPVLKAAQPAFAREAGRHNEQTCRPWLAFTAATGARSFLKAFSALQ